MTAPTTGDKAPLNPYAFTPPEDDTSWKIVRNVRIALTLGLAPLGISAFRDEYGQVPLLDGIILAIHEFGHMFFQPFGVPVLGETMVILGGSLMQVVIPLLFVGYFMFSRKHRDRHAAMVCLWWAGISLLGVAIYAADARAGQLQLINGLTGQDEDSGHDWQNLFWRWGVLNRDTFYAARMRDVAALMCFVSVVAGLWFALQRPAPRQEE